MIIDLSTLAIFIPTVFILVVTPGPDLIFITASSLSLGKRRGVASAFGCTSGAFLHAVLAAFGLTAVIAIWQPAYELVRIGGAAYLAYLGIKMMLSKTSPLSVDLKTNEKSGWQVYRQGLITNLMNPKAILFSLTFLPQFANPERGPIWAQIVMLGVILSIIMLTIVIPVALTSGHFGQWLGRREKTAMLLNRTMGAALVALAAYVFKSRRFTVSVP